MKNAVILGNSGFVGRALERKLTEAGVAVHGFSSKSLDLTRAESLKALDSVVAADTHLFFVASLTPDRGVDTRTMSRNVAMAANLAAHLEASTKRPAWLTYVSTDAVYPASVEEVDEATATFPESYYGVGKLAAEGVLRAAARAASVELLVLRPTGLFGAGDPHNSYGPNRFLRSALAERTVKLFGDGDELRDHLYLDDFVRATVGLAVSRATGIVNVASGTSRTFVSIALELRAVAPFEIAVMRQPRSGAVVHRRYAVSRLRQLLPDFEPTPFVDALRASFEAASAR